MLSPAQSTVVNWFVSADVSADGSSQVVLTAWSVFGAAGRRQRDERAIVRRVRRVLRRDADQVLRQLAQLARDAGREGAQERAIGPGHQDLLVVLDVLVNAVGDVEVLDVDRVTAGLARTLDDVGDRGQELLLDLADPAAPGAPVLPPMSAAHCADPGRSDAIGVAGGARRADDREQTTRLTAARRGVVDVAEGDRQTARREGSPADRRARG